MPVLVGVLIAYVFFTVTLIVSRTRLQIHQASPTPVS